MLSDLKLTKLAAVKLVPGRPSLPPHDRNDPYDHITPAQRQQRISSPLPRQQFTVSPRPDDRSSTPSSRLRRTPRFQATPSPRPSETQRRIHLEAVTVGISQSPRLAAAPPVPNLGYDQQRPRTPRRQLSQDLSDELEASTYSPSFAPDRLPDFPTSQPGPHPIVRVSSHTKNAILWALEEALRQPHPFSPDLIEENASMADLLASAGGPATSNGNAVTSSRPTAPPAQTGSPVIRGPRMIMQERREREARQRAEREQMERARAEEEARLLEETTRRTAQRRESAAGAAGDISADPATQRRQQRAQAAQAEARAQHQTPAPEPTPVPRPLRTTRVPTSQQPPQTGAGNQATTQPAESSNQAPSATRVKNSFPHAFERWEALSAHWEGMTSFWIRKLQENTEELERNPISAQLSRQVGDLSAAGANLFHAVVELQRLRASSERKFQRWFFETRGEMERHQEVTAMLEAQLQEERQRRAEAIREAVENERNNSKTQKLVAEMRKELLISKEEARRAWEELGRREQEERDRTISLQQGRTTIVGGVQVVPMTQGVPSRQTSAREPRSHSQQADTSDYVAAQAGHYPEYTTQAPPAQASVTQAGAGAGSSGGYYQQQQHAQQPETSAHETASYGGGSEAGYSEGEYVIDAQGNFARDTYGNKIPYQSPNSPPRGARGSDVAAEDYETPASQPTTSYPPSSSHYAATHGGGGSNPEYSGQGYAAPGWETMQSMPRHHHPTRLSDVIEEDDERSRTSASVSRA
ncbi:hypothetical protein V8F06_001726 [Rhypophila decipiens]